MSRSKVISDPICMKNGLYATIEIEKNTKSIEKLKNKYFNTREKGDDKYVIFKKIDNFKCKSNPRQICNVVSIECFICYDENMCSKNETEDLLYYYHPSLGKSYIASKLAIVYKPKKCDIKLQPIFFRELAKYFKSLHFDSICIKELHLVADHFDTEEQDSMINNCLTRPDGTKTILFDISKHFANASAQKCDGISQQI